MNFKTIKKDCEHLVKRKNTDWCFKKDMLCSIDNCFKTLPLISHGTTKSMSVMCTEGVNNNLTPKQLRALKYRNEGLTFQSIADKMNITRPAAYKLFNKSLKKIGGLTKGVNKYSLHNDSISFEIECTFYKVKGKTIRLKYSKYKLIKNDDRVIQVFHKKIVIKFRKEILGKSTDECFDLATKRIHNYITKFSMKGITKIFRLEQLSRHYAISGTAIARKCIREGKKTFIYEPGSNDLAIFVDFSDKNKKGGTPHLESPHLLRGKKYIDKNDAFLEDVTFRSHYLPSQTKTILDTILLVQEEYAYQIKKHLLVQDETLITLKKIQKSLDK